jgi:hypothetical protein
MSLPSVPGHFRHWERIDQTKRIKSGSPACQPLFLTALLLREELIHVPVANHIITPFFCSSPDFHVVFLSSEMVTYHSQSLD